MSFLNLFGGDKKTTTNTANNTTNNTSVADSYNTNFTQALTKNVSNIDASSNVSNFALDASRAYNLANVGNVSSGTDSGWLAELGSSLDLNKFFESTNTDKSPALDNSAFASSISMISDKLAALTGLASAVGTAQTNQTKAAAEASPTNPSAGTKNLLLVIALAIAGVVAVAFIIRKK